MDFSCFKCRRIHSSWTLSNRAAHDHRTLGIHSLNKVHSSSSQTSLLAFKTSVFLPLLPPYCTHFQCPLSSHKTRVRISETVQFWSQRDLYKFCLCNSCCRLSENRQTWRGIMGLKKIVWQFQQVSELKPTNAGKIAELILWLKITHPQLLWEEIRNLEKNSMKWGNSKVLRVWCYFLHLRKGRKVLLTKAKWQKSKNIHSQGLWLSLRDQHLPFLNRCLLAV